MENTSDTLLLLLREATPGQQNGHHLAGAGDASPTRAGRLAVLPDPPERAGKRFAPSTGRWPTGAVELSLFWSRRSSRSARRGQKNGSGDTIVWPISWYHQGCGEWPVGFLGWRCHAVTSVAKGALRVNEIKRTEKIYWAEYTSSRAGCQEAGGRQKSSRYSNVVPIVM